MSKILVIVIINWFAQINSYANTDGELISCQYVIDNKHLLNARDLWLGATDCGKKEDLYKINFLLIIGQIRAMTDMMVLKAVSDEEEVKMADLYGMLYYKTGGSGYDEIYRDKNKSNLLFNELHEWKPTLNKTYNPGWEYKTLIDKEKYTQMVICQKATRIDQLNWYASLIRNDRYFIASQQYSDFKKKNPGSIEYGTDIHREMESITSRMNKASEAIQRKEPKLKECDFVNKYEPDTDANFNQVYKGANGPNRDGANIYVSKNDVLESWISKSLSSTNLLNILNEIDFEKQVLVSLSFGRRTNATGTLYISDVKYNKVYKSLRISGLVGVNEKNCKETLNNSYPFVLAVAPRPDKIPVAPNMSIQNFPDGCKSVISGNFVTGDKLPILHN